jgi:hypothetical protein
MLQRPARSGIGLDTALLIFRRTSRTIASAACARMLNSVWGSAWPAAPARRTVTSVIAGSRAAAVGGVVGCLVLAADDAALAYEAGVRLVCGGEDLPFPFFPFPFRATTV